MSHSRRIVGACQLLERKDYHAQYYPVEHPEPCEHVVPWVFSSLLGLEFLFHFLHLFPDNDVILPNAIELTDAIRSFVNLSLPVVESRSLRKQENTESKDEGKDETDTSTTLMKMNSKKD